jgi:hypothetical protein
VIEFLDEEYANGDELRIGWLAKWPIRLKKGTGVECQPRYLDIQT